MRHILRISTNNHKNPTRTHPSRASQSTEPASSRYPAEWSTRCGRQSSPRSSHRETFQRQSSCTPSSPAPECCRTRSSCVRHRGVSASLRGCSRRRRGSSGAALSRGSCEKEWKIIYLHAGM
jgi:hypothetical protein